MNKIGTLLKKYKIWKKEKNEINKKDPTPDEECLSYSFIIQTDLNTKRFLLVKNLYLNKETNYLSISFKEGKLLYEYWKELYEENDNEKYL